MLEDAVGIERDDIDSGHLSEDIDADGQKGAIEVTVRCPRERILGVALRVCVEAVENDLRSSGDDFLVLVLIRESCKHRSAFGLPILGQ